MEKITSSTERVTNGVLVAPRRMLLQRLKYQSMRIWTYTKEIPWTPPVSNLHAANVITKINSALNASKGTVWSLVHAISCPAQCILLRLSSKWTKIIIEVREAFAPGLARTLSPSQTGTFKHFYINNRTICFRK